ncbi:MAG: hypothetical protein KTR26_16865 [Flammeovirgaceae bacterium]|nr:hypothetical protein [Flammeovirgaceae bacterium]
MSKVATNNAQEELESATNKLSPKALRFVRAMDSLDKKIKIFAEEIGMDYQKVINLRNGRSDDIPMESYLKMEELYGFNRDWLAFGFEPKYRKDMKLPNKYEKLEKEMNITVPEIIQDNQNLAKEKDILNEKVKLLDKMIVLLEQRVKDLESQLGMVK